MNDSAKTPPTLQVVQAQRDKILALANQYGAYNVRVFGSVARGDARPDSDIDIMADFHPHTLIERITLMHQLSDLLGYPVDLVPEKSLRLHVRSQALTEAVPL